jgi:hypothetical protein
MAARVSRLTPPAVNAPRLALVAARDTRLVPTMASFKPLAFVALRKRQIQ